MDRIRQLTMLLARLALGVIFVAHGWQKFHDWGLTGTAASFTKMGVPAPTVCAWYAAIVEFGGGIALILGVALPAVGVLLALDMLGALVFVDGKQGLLGGYELVLALGVAALVVGFNGGAVSVDHLFARRRKAATTPAQQPVG